MPAQSRFRLSWRFRSHDALPRRRQAVHVLRVDRSRPAPIARLFRGKAHEVQIELVEELGASIGPRRPGQRRNRVDDELEIALARARGPPRRVCARRCPISRLYQRTMCPFDIPKRKIRETETSGTRHRNAEHAMLRTSNGSPDAIERVKARRRVDDPQDVSRRRSPSASAPPTSCRRSPRIWRLTNSTLTVARNGREPCPECCRRSAATRRSLVTQRLLSTLPLVDVRQQHAPANDVTACIAKRKAVVLEPAIRAVRTSKPLHNRVWVARANRLCEDLNDVREVLRVNGVVRSPLFQLLQRSVRCIRRSGD